MVAKLYQYSHCYPSSFMFNIIYLECLTIIRLIADQYLSVPQYPAAIRIFACASISCRYPDICPCLNILLLSGYLPAPQYPAAIRIFVRASISCRYPDICPRLNILPLSGYCPCFNILPLSGYLPVPQYPAAIRIFVHASISCHYPDPLKKTDQPGYKFTFCS